MDTLESFGSRVKEALEANGMTQAELASRLEVSPALINRWMKGGKACPKRRLAQIGEILGVAPESLSGGAEDSRPAALERANWVFRQAPEDGGRDYGNSNVFATPPDIKTLVRETGQNSRDQREYPHMHVRYTLIELRRGTDEYDSFLDALRFDELRNHVYAAGKTESRVGKKLKGGLARLDDAKKFYLLRIDDFGTTGLYGSERSDVDLSPFAALIKNNLDSSKSGATAGGSYGLGKAVLWRCSGLSTVLFATKIAPGYGDGRQDGELRFIAKSELTWHGLGDANYHAGPGWLGTETKSIWCDSADLSPLFLDRQNRPDQVPAAEDSGTSALIVDFRDLQSDEELKPEEVLRTLKEECAINFWPAIAKGDLSISIEFRVGEKLSSTDVVDPRETAARPFVEAYEAFTGGEITPHPEPGETSRADVMLTVPATRSTAAEVEPSQPTHDAQAVLLVRLAEPDDLDHKARLGSVAMFRGRGMVVDYWNRRNIVVGGRAFHAVLMAGEAAGGGDAATAADIFLKLSEPPAHDRWVFGETLADNYERGARSRLAEMWDDISSKIKELIRPEDGGVEDEPEELKRLLQIGSVEEQPKLARLIKPSSVLDGDKWVVEGEIKVLDRRAGIDARVAISVVPESGSQTPLEWESLAVTKKVRGEAAELPDNKTIRIQPKTSSVRFKGVSKPGPAALRLDRCIASLSFAASKTPDAEREGA